MGALHLSRGCDPQVRPETIRAYTQLAQLQRPSAETLLPHKPPTIARSAGLRRIDQSVTMQFMLFGAIDSFLPSLRYSEVCCVVFLFSRSHAQKAKYK